ncbi:hypothetical protein PR048_004993, partial [Dryococelus australis]
MCIEQTLMRCIKSRSGIPHGGGMTESQCATWILSHSRCSEIAYAMSLLTGVSRISNSENKVTTEKKGGDIGRNIHDKLTGKLLKNVTMFKSDQAVTMKILKKAIINADETHHIHSHLLTQRMFVCFSLDNASKYAREYFSYELSTVSPSLFDPWTQLMRKTDKSTLAIALDTLNVAKERHITAVADDTDILVLLLYHCCRNISMQFTTHCGHVRDIQAMQKSIGKEVCKTLLFAHALTGCDTNSALFAKSKTSAFQHICKSETLYNWDSVIGSQENVSRDKL